MASRTFTVVPHPLTYVRRRRGWSQAQLVEAIARSARSTLGIHLAARREKACRWEHGVVPDLVTQRALAAALDVPPELVDLLPWPRWLPVDEVATDIAWSIEGCLQALDEAVEEALLDRRGFMTIGGTSLIAVAAGWAGCEPARAVGALRGGRLDEETVIWAEQRIPGLRRMDDRLSGKSLLKLVDADLHMVDDLLTHAAYTDALGRRLYRIAAELAQLAGWVAFDIGMQSAAQRYYLAALHSAHAAGDRPLGANALACMSFQAALAGNPHDGVQLARTAAEGAPDCGPRVLALVASREARAHARADDRPACERALLRAEHLLEEADGHGRGSEPAWVYYFDEAELQAQAGACWLDLDRPERAGPLLKDALARQDPSYVRDRTIYLVRAAASELKQQQVDAACDLGRQAAQLAATSHSGRSIDTLTAFRKQLLPYAATSYVKALDADIDALAVHAS